MVATNLGRTKSLGWTIGPKGLGKTMGASSLGETKSLGVNCESQKPREDHECQKPLEDEKLREDLGSEKKREDHASPTCQMGPKRAIYIYIHVMILSRTRNECHRTRENEKSRMDHRSEKPREDNGGLTPPGSEKPRGEL